MLAELRATLAPCGLDLIGATPLARYDAAAAPEHALSALAPTARSAIVIGNGGGAFWAAFREATRARPRLAVARDPLDRFTEEVIDQAVRRATPPGATVRVLYPFRFPSEPVSFMRLAACAGLGTPSQLGVLIHPRYGPWIALRAAVLVPFELDEPGPALGFDPCPTCVERACEPVCPVGAIDARGWNVPACAAHRLGEPAGDAERCATRCHARVACVIGREHRYPDDALAYHQERALPALAGF